jgi:2-polyprenyl-3-methyl-5-hydroxy-6-metoxy-1,4-benzoquinol methylase
MIASGSDNGLFDWVDGQAFYCQQRVEFRELAISGHSFKIAALTDAAGLLDHDEFAKPFLEEDRAPYGLELWPAASMLAQLILNDEPGQGRSALDLGCGVGLVSLAAVSRGWNVTAADHDPAALDFAQYNARANDISLLSYERWDWRRPPRNHCFDRVFAADVLYQLVDHQPILDCLLEVLSREGAAYIADPNRRVADRFPEMARGVFHVKQVSLGRWGSELQAGRLLILTRRK